MAKEEGNESYSMNKNTNNNNNDYIITDDYNNHIEDDNTNLKHKSQVWGTWEELLLACAVKRHGFSDWDSVATELRSRTCAVFVSANNCKIKYRDLKRRFHESAGKRDVTAAEGGEEEMVGNIPEQLRNLRVEELRREVQRHDVSILSLELKVKKLEEEREGKVVGEEKPDLEDERKRERLENRSMNESNSTTSGEKIDRVSGDEPSQTRDDSDNNNLETNPKEGSNASHSDESGTSGRKRRKHSAGNGGDIKSAVSKSQPLIGVLDRIRSHPRGSLFERRLRSQEKQDYKRMVKQHLSIETIHRKLKQGSYDSSSVSFYRDLQLLFTNAIVFFPLSSSESMAAHELRTVVVEEMRKETGKSGPKLIDWHSSKADYETSDSSLSRQKSSAPLQVCKKRKFVSPSSSSFSQREETKEETLLEENENIVTGVRSSGRANKGKNKQKQNETKTNSSNEKNSKQETGKTTEKKADSSKKKKSVNEFLKRLKNSPQKEGKVQNKSGGSNKKESKTKPRELRSNNVGKKIENTPVKRAPGRPQKKTTPTPSALGKRGKGKQKQGKG